MIRNGSVAMVAISACLWIGDAGARTADTTTGDRDDPAAGQVAETPPASVAPEIYGWFGGYVGTGNLPDAVDLGPSFGFTLGRFRQQGPGFLGVELALGPTPTHIPPYSLVPWYWPKVAFHGGAMHPGGTDQD